MKDFTYDGSKNLWSRHTSVCHDAPVKKKMLWQGKVVKDPNFKIVTSGKFTINEPSNRKFWQFWKPKEIKRTVELTNTKDVRYRYFCTVCDKQCKDKWEFKHER